MSLSRKQYTGFSLWSRRAAFVAGWVCYALALSAIVAEWFAQGFDDYPLTITGLMVFALYIAAGFLCAALTADHWPQEKAR